MPVNGREGAEEACRCLWKGQFLSKVNRSQARELCSERWLYFDVNEHLCREDGNEQYRGSM